MRKYARIDGTHNQIVAALRQIGCSVQSLADVHGGCPDLMVARNGKLFLIEVKNGRLAPSAQRLTLLEQLWHRDWKSKVHVCNSVESALEAVNGIDFVT